MTEQNQTQVSAGILNVCSYAGVIGAALSLVSDIPLKGVPRDLENFMNILSNIGDIAFDISLGVVLLFAVKKIKTLNEKKPSPMIFSILIGTLALSFIATLCTFGEPYSEDLFLIISFLLFVVMMIVTGIVCLRVPATKKIGIWMIGAIVGGIVAAIIADCLDSVNKLTVILIMGIYAVPVGKLFDEIKNYLLGDKDAKLETT